MYVWKQKKKGKSHIDKEEDRNLRYSAMNCKFKNKNQQVWWRVFIKNKRALIGKKKSADMNKNFHQGLSYFRIDKKNKNFSQINAKKYFIRFLLLKERDGGEGED